MPELTLEEKLAAHTGKSYVIAPAGFGKTHLIALSIEKIIGCGLVLTHTFAGVSAIKKKMNTVGVDSSKYRIDTIASWSLRLCLAYSKNSNFTIEKPNSNAEWTELYNSCSSLLEKRFIKKIIEASYSSVFVDEYQDCSKTQHALVTKLAQILPCKLLGDPMQSVFDFSDQPVDWDEDVYPEYECLGQLVNPWRWVNSGTENIGTWLISVREQLNLGKSVDISRNLPSNVSYKCIDLDNFKVPRRFKPFWDSLSHSGSVVVIYPGNRKYKAQQLARSLSGQYVAIDEVEGKDLFRFIDILSNKDTPKEKILASIEFAKKCMCNANGLLSNGTKRGEIVSIKKNTKEPIITDAANHYLQSPTSENLKTFFSLIKNNSTTSTPRKDLLNRFFMILNVHIGHPEISLLEAANIFQTRFRHNGRPINYQRIIGTTLLLKGLEFDHVIIAEAEKLTKNEFYVALTRGSKSITIISKETCLPKKT